MNTHPRLRAAIVAACPELMELKNGCKLLVRWTEEAEPELVEFSDRCMRDNGNETIIEDNIVGEIVEIIGHEIGLEHVLRTLDRLPLSRRYTVMAGGTFVLINSANSVSSTDKIYDLAKPFDLQPPATLDWLESVICPEV